MPVPYNMEFELSIMCKINDDMLQIIEQIVPYFQPSYNLTVNLIESIGEKRDIPVVLDNISMQDDYEGNFTTRRVLIYTLRFTAKTYLFGPVSSSVSTDIIKKVSLGFVSGDSQSTTRDLTYSQESVAAKSYTNNVVTTLAADVLVADGTISVQNSSSISVNSHITLDNETLKITNKNGNILTVERGSYSTNISDHVSGTQVMLITSADTDLIELGDDFGFSGISFE